jgi:hypothetical protein
MFLPSAARSFYVSSSFFLTDASNFWNLVFGACSTYATSTLNELVFHILLLIINFSVNNFLYCKLAYKYEFAGTCYVFSYESCNLNNCLRYLVPNL